MKEIGGYLELDNNWGSMLHNDGIKLNCGRNALLYIVKAKQIKKLYMPKFMCDSCNKVLRDNEVSIVYYNIDLNFMPIIDKRDGWLYLVNFYGQLSNEYIASLGEHIIVDNAQAYFQEPVNGIDTLYTCRKFFGVADGAILYTNKHIDIIEQDISYSRMNYLLGRYEKSASEFYQEYVNNNLSFNDSPIMKMSRLTENILRGIDYDSVKKKRTDNFEYLNVEFESLNKLHLLKTEGAFMYPLYINNGMEIRKKLQKKNIYIPILWPAVLNLCNEKELEFDMAKNIIPLPVDQRYSTTEMRYVIDSIEALL